MRAPPKVAIITATHNHERYIGACIESALAQTMADWEMVVIDDGSSDRTLEIVRGYVDDRIAVETRATPLGLAGLAATYGQALAMTSAPLVAILEGDDTWPAAKLETQLPAFERDDVVLAYGAAAQIDSAGCVYARYSRKPPGAAADNRPLGAIVPYLLEQNFIVAATVIVRRTALDGIGGFWQPTGIPYVDHPTWLKLALKGAFAWHDDVVGNWRRHAAQFTTSNAVGSQPDNVPFRRTILAEASAAGLLDDAHAAEERLAESGGRHDAWSDVAALRLALLNGTGRDAVRAAQALVRPRRGWPKWIALAVIGLACRAAGSDLEWIFRRTNRFSWPPRRHRHAAADPRQDGAVS